MLTDAEAVLLVLLSRRDFASLSLKKPSFGYVDDNRPNVCLLDSSSVRIFWEALVVSYYLKSFRKLFLQG